MPSALVGGIFGSADITQSVFNEKDAILMNDALRCLRKSCTRFRLCLIIAYDYLDLRGNYCAYKIYRIKKFYNF